MAHIVEFRSGAAREAAEPEPGALRGAEIIIFPGVRRERYAEPADARAPRRDGAGAKRDYLDLPD
jgi:hypothetical protein